MSKYRVKVVATPYTDRQTAPTFEVEVDNLSNVETEVYRLFSNSVKPARSLEIASVIDLETGRTVFISQAELDTLSKVKHSV